MYKLHHRLFLDIRDTWQLAISSDDLEEFRFKADRFGDEYVAIWLPELDDFLLASLAAGNTVTCPPMFPGEPYPRFLSGLWKNIFDPSGILLDDPCVESIRAIRQLTRFQKKVFEVCEDKYVELAVKQFIKTDSELPISIACSQLSRVNAVLHGSELFKSVSDSYNFSHGPGATAEKLDSVERWDFPTISRSLASRFMPWDFFPERYDEDFTCEIVDPIGRLESVPKTFDKPRLISIEPASSIYAQKGLLARLAEWMNRTPQLNMSDQTRNKLMARRGSIDGSLTTIDLSEASDRVSMALVEAVFKHSPSFLSLISDMRTGAVNTREGLVVLNKFASMGCALTFPIQMIVFRSIVIKAIVCAENDLSSRNIRSWGRSPDIGIFGDDIIIPSAFAEPVYNALRSYGLAINEKKSFTTGPFRESCGGDYVFGQPVNPVYLRQRSPSNWRDADRIASWAAMSHLLSEAQLPGAALYVSNVLQNLVGPMPSGMGLISVSDPWPSIERTNDELQRREVKGVALRFSRRKTMANEVSQLRFALNRVRGSDKVTFVLDKNNTDAFDPLGLTHHGRPTRAFITRRWADRESDLMA